MSELLKSVVGVTGNVAAPSRSMDGSALPPPDRLPTENWDADLTKYAQQEGGGDGTYNHQGEFTDSPSSGSIIKTFDEIMAESNNPVSDETIEATNKLMESPEAAVVSGMKGVAVEATPQVELIEIGVDVEDIGVIPFKYAGAYWDDNFLALAVHPDHKTINFKLPTKDNIKSITLIIESLGKKVTVVPLCQRLNSVTKSGLPLQLFRVRALESIEVASG